MFKTKATKNKSLRYKKGDTAIEQWTIDLEQIVYI